MAVLQQPLVSPAPDSCFHSVIFPILAQLLSSQLEKMAVRLFICTYLVSVFNNLFLSRLCGVRRTDYLAAFFSKEHFTFIFFPSKSLSTASPHTPHPTFMQLATVINGPSLHFFLFFFF